MPKLDVSAVRRSIKKGQTAAIGSLGPGGRPRTGTKAFVREYLDTILQLRAETGATWIQMVGALAEQHDLRQGDGRPITGRRLNALVSACLKERARIEAAVTARRTRADLTQVVVPARRRDLVEAKDLAQGPEAQPRSPDTPVLSPASEPDLRSEEDLRRSGFAELKQLLRKG